MSSVVLPAPSMRPSAATGYRVIRVIRTVVFWCLLFADKIGRALIQIGQTDLARPISRHCLGGAGAPVGHRKDCTLQSGGSKLVRDIQKDPGLFGIDLVQLRSLPFFFSTSASRSCCMVV